MLKGRSRKSVKSHHTRIERKIKTADKMARKTDRQKGNEKERKIGRIVLR